ncbi:non-ribosomal peptide synthetase [Aeromonas salmonicida]|uniref:non-ribosomal peptide synthetase n=2 Tax=Aeromonas salmonicida TaxID=645 RepID=UPI00223F95D5|nr:non-ribosomal peptide synthetase [Aeromonas salmonicida]
MNSIVLKRTYSDSFANVDVLPTTGQARILEQQAQQLSNRSYHELLLLKGNGIPDVARLQSSLGEVVTRHQSLSTNFIFVDEKLVPWDASGAELEWLQVRLEQTEDISSVLNDWISQDLVFLERLPLRVGLILKPDHYYIAIVVHHVAIDGWSFMVLLREWSELMSSGRLIEPAPIFSRYYSGELVRLQHGNVAREAFWRKYLEHAPAFSLPTPDLHCSDRMDRKGGVMVSRLGEDDWSLLSSLARKNNCSEFVALQVLFSSCLCRLYRRTSVVISSPCANRIATDSHGVIGFLANTLPFHIEYSPEETFLAAIKKQRSISMTALSHQQLGYDTILELSGTETRAGISPLSQVFLVLQNISTDMPKLNGDDISICADLSPREIKAELTLECQPAVDGAKFIWRYATGLYKEETIAGIDKALTNITRSALLSPDIALCDLPLIDDEELKAIAVYSNRKMDIPDGTVVDWIRNNARVIGTSPAILASDGGYVSYQELEQRTNSVANSLNALGIRNGDIVALYMSRSINMFVGMLGVLKSGAAYLALDPDYPSSRTEFMIDDSNVSYIIVDAIRPQSNLNYQCLEMETLLNEVTGGSSFPVLNNDHVAYINYSSGSTGKPKASILSHRGLRNTAFNFNKSLSISHGDRLLQFSSPAFDACTAEWVMAFVNQATLVLLEPEHSRDINHVTEIVQQQRVTHLHLPPSVLSLLSPNSLSSVRVVISIGEAMTPAVKKTWQNATKLYNGYGPSEFTIATHMHLCSELNTPNNIGQAFYNTSCYVVDQHMSILPIGFEGELVLGGDGIANGYLNREELTRKFFLKKLGNAIVENRVYRTGDLVKWNEVGELLYIGRTDSQIKINGVRVETDEIVNVLCQYRGVLDAVCWMPSSGNESRLLSTIVIDNKNEVTHDEVYNHMLSCLPRSMLPNSVIILTSLPRTPNNKVDYNALTEIANDELESTNSNNIELNELQTKLLGFFNEVLTKTVGPNSNFFAYGGHSLSASRLVARIRSDLGKRVPLSIVYEYPTVIQLATQLTDGDSGDTHSTEKAIDQRSMILATPSQREFWRFDRHVKSPAFHIQEQLLLDGELNKEALLFSIENIVKRHQSLHSTFCSDGDNLWMRLDSTNRVLIIQASALDVEWSGFLEGAVRAGFDINNGPLIKFYLFQHSALKHTLLIMAHHIIIDGWSLQNLTRELALFYGGYSTEGVSFKAPVLQTSFFDYAKNQSCNEDRNLLYWNRRVGQKHRWLSLPGEKVNNNICREVNSIDLIIPPSLFLQLRAISFEHKVTPFVTLYSVMSIFLAQQCKLEKIVLGTVVAHRPMPDDESIIGLCLSSALLVCDYDPDKTLSDYLHKHQREFIECLDHLPLDVTALNNYNVKDFEHGRYPVYQMMMVMQNFEGQPLILPDINVSRIPIPSKEQEVDHYLSIETTGDGGMTITWSYRKSMFDKSDMERNGNLFISYLKTMLYSTETVGRNSIEYKSALPDDQLKYFGAAPCSVNKTQLIARKGYEYHHRLAPRIHLQLKSKCMDRNVSLVEWLYTCYIFTVSQVKAVDTVSLKLELLDDELVTIKSEHAMHPGMEFNAVIDDVGTIIGRENNRICIDTGDYSYQVVFSESNNNTRDINKHSSQSFIMTFKYIDSDPYIFWYLEGTVHDDSVIENVAARYTAILQQSLYNFKFKPMESVFEKHNLFGIRDRALEKVFLKSGDSNFNIICIPGVLGQSECFSHLIGHLSCDAMVIGFNAILDSEAFPVEVYLSALDEFDLSKSVLLCHSMGGGIAARVSEELKNKGKIRPPVILLDSWPTERVIPSFMSIKDHFMMTVANSLGNNISFDISKDSNALINFDYVSNLLCDQNKKPMFSVEQIKAMFARYCNQRSYEISVSSGMMDKVALIEPCFGPSPKMYWQPICESPLLTCSIDAGHDTMLLEPYVSETAKVIDYLLPFMFSNYDKR